MAPSNKATSSNKKRKQSNNSLNNKKIKQTDTSSNNSSNQLDSIEFIKYIGNLTSDYVYQNTGEIIASNLDKLNEELMKEIDPKELELKNFLEKFKNEIIVNIPSFGIENFKSDKDLQICSKLYSRCQRILNDNNDDKNNKDKFIDIFSKSSNIDRNILIFYIC